MLQALKDTQKVLQYSANLLLMGPGADIPGIVVSHYSLDDVRHNHDAIGEKHTITIGLEVSIKKLLVFNSLPFARHELVSFIVSTPFVEVINSSIKLI